MSAPRDLPHNIHAHELGSGHAPPGWMFMPGYIVLPLVREPLGYEIVHPLRAAGQRVIVAALGFLVFITYPPAVTGPEWFYGYLGVSFVAACIAFTRRAIGQRRGEQIHTAECGWSYLARFTSLPVWLCEQVLVPLGIAALGYFTAQTVSFLLGWFWVLTGASLALMGHWESARRRAQMRTTVDDLLRAQAFGERLADQEQQAYARPTGRSTAGQGDEPDVAELGAARRRNAYASAPDAMSWTHGGIVPDVMTWFRRRRG
jgi:hypothetical protein